MIVTIFFSFSLTFLFYTYYYLQDVQEIYMKMKIGDIIGFDTNSSVISFGIVPIGGSSERKATLKNMQGIPLRVRTKKMGEMAKWVYVSEEDFILEAYEEKELKFTAVPSTDAKKGAYDGSIRFVFTRVI